MKKIYFLLLTLLASTAFFAQSVFINEIHYDDAGADADEGIEIAGPAGTDLSTYTLTPYNGSNGAAYSVTALSGVIPNEGGTGYGAVFFPISGLQNGAPDGIALDNSGALIQFLSYEGSFAATAGVANGVTSTDIGVSENGTVEGESLQLVGTGNVYSDFTWAASSASSYNLINPGQTFGASSPSIIINSPSNGTVFIPGTTSVDVIFTTNNLVGGETVDITVNGSTTTNVTSPFNIVTTNGTVYSVTVELVDGGVIDSDNISFEVGNITSVADLAALRADFIANGPGAYYELLSTPTVTYTRTSRNQKYIQDASAGILIDDVAGTIATSFSIGDGISGVIGQASDYNGVLQFVPLQDATVTAGVAITPAVVTVATLLTDWEDYESQLVRINNATFADAGGTFANATDYDLSDGSIINFRTNFSDADYIGQTIPTGANPVVGLISEFGGNPQITARSLTDVTLSTPSFETTNFSIYPNPTSTGFINITSTTADAMSVAVFDVLGKQVINETISNNRLNVSSLNAGLYIVKISQNNATTTKKLVIK